MVVDKPAGILVTPDKEKRHTLTDILNKECRNSDSLSLYPCHRLDKDTTGLIIYAKGKLMRERLMQQFKNHAVKKSYIAFVHGAIKKNEFTIRNYIAGKSSITIVKLLIGKKEFSILKINPITGRKNQIRIHLKQLGHPLLGERKFAFARDYALKFRRTALHACELEFRHPVSNKMLHFRIDLAADMRNFLLTYN